MIISRTPLRVSLFGGGSDFPEYYEKHGGAVLSTAIDKYVYVIVKKRFDDKIVLHYTKTEVCDSIDEIQHDYIRESMRLCGVEDGIEITTLADIPSEGTGLGSSSSLAVGLIYALYSYAFNNSPLVHGAKSLAEIACGMEIDGLQKGIGVQDQYIAAYGGFRFMTFDKCGVHVLTEHENKLVNRFSKQKRSLEYLEKRLLLFYTGVTRQASPILQEQASNMEAKKVIINRMAVNAGKAQGYIEKGTPENIGRMLHSYWNMKKSLAGSISNPEIDQMYDKAIHAGAIGGKICGAGGGGFLLLYVNPNKQDSVREALKGYQELPFKFEPEGSKIILS